MGWQDAVAIAVVSGAAFYLSSLAWKGLIGGKGGGGSCGTSCGKCSSDAGASLASGAAAPGMVVSIGSPPNRTVPAQAEPAEAP